MSTENTSVATNSQDKVIEVTIKTIDGDQDNFHFNVKFLVQKAKEMALHKFHIKPGPGVVYKLASKNADGTFRPLDDNKTLQDEGVKDGDTLFLGTEQQVG
jgi:hypothetical protein